MIQIQKLGNISASNLFRHEIEDLITGKVSEEYGCDELIIRRIFMAMKQTAKEINDAMRKKAANAGVSR